MVGIACHEQGVALCHAVPVDGELRIAKLEFAQLDESKRCEFVKNWVNRHKLKFADSYIVLSQHEYELELIEAPPVEPDEMLEAVRWRLKDLISIPVEEAVIDIFHLPEDAYRGRKKMLYVVAASKDTIENKIKLIKDAGLDLQVIDIEELALRNLSLFVPGHEQGTVAFLSMKENNGHIHMFCHENMYLTRSIEMGYASFVPQENDQWQIEREDHGSMVERYILDVQRSLDYYESQVGKGIANKLYVLPSEMDESDIVTHLQAMLTQDVANFDCKDIVPFTEGVEPSLAQQALCLPAIGAVFRRGRYATN